MKTDTLEKNEKGQVTLLGEILRLILKLLVLIVIFVIVLTFIFGINRYNYDDMIPAIKAGDVMLYYRLDKTYKSGDIAIVEYLGEEQARRVVAVAGDTINLDEEGFKINGSVQQEKLVFDETLPFLDGIDFPITLKEGEIFLLGDKREDAIDSRLYGAIDINDTKGKVILLIRRWNL
ncbi:MAG: signal peptidase I [Suipraeoptans sp.]